MSGFLPTRPENQKNSDALTTEKVFRTTLQK